MSRDNFLLVSGGLDSTVMARYLHDEVFGQTRPRVVFFDTTIGMPAQRAYVELLCDHYGWQLHVIRTEENFDEVSKEYKFYCPDTHDDIFEKLKGRQVDALTTIAEDPHFYWGVYRDESPVREEVVVEQWEDDRGAVHHAPLHDWTEAEVIEYAREHDIPPNPLWKNSHYTDCGCGATAAREELLEAKAEGFEIFARRIERIEAQVDADDQTGTWAWASFDTDQIKTIKAKADRAQCSLASWGCGPTCSTAALPDGGTAEPRRAESAPHHCDICNTPFQSVAALATHDCSPDDREVPG